MDALPWPVESVVAGATRVTVVPARGAIVSGLELGGRSILHMDAATLADAGKNVRGGVPILFPFAGKLADDALRASGTRMKQHGFGRNLPWQVTARSDAALTLTLAPDEGTRAQYPFEFACQQTVTALANGVDIALAVTNQGAAPLPLSPGWHPYFACAAADKAKVEVGVDGYAPGAIDDAGEHDFGLVAPASGVVPLVIPGLGALSLSFSPEMRHLQLWSLPGRPFVCIEPFWGPADTINGERRCELAPGATQRFWMRIALD